jgi:hypothetical protein
MIEGEMQELGELPARVAGVESQIVQLREEMRESFSAVRSELHEEVSGLRDDLRAEIRAGDQATRDFMRMLYEEHKTTLRTVDEGKKGRKR